MRVAADQIRLPNRAESDIISFTTQRTNHTPSGPYRIQPRTCNVRTAPHRAHIMKNEQIPAHVPRSGHRCRPIVTSRRLMRSVATKADHRMMLFTYCCPMPGPGHDCSMSPDTRRRAQARTFTDYSRPCVWLAVRPATLRCRPDANRLLATSVVNPDSTGRQTTPTGPMLLALRRATAAGCDGDLGALRTRNCVTETCYLVGCFERPGQGRPK